MKPGTGHIQALTSLRFFAALLVVVFHHGQNLFVSCPIWWQNIIKGGYVGVPFFFVLSGFILTHTYARRTASTSWNPRPFWRARFARVYPVYFLSLVLSAPIFWFALSSGTTPEAAGPQFGLHAMAVVGLAQSWIPAWSFSWNGPAWSLSVEAFFYAVFPFLMLASSRMRGRWLLGMAAGGMAMLVFARMAPAWNPIAGLQRLLGWANPLLWLPLFLLGICAAELSQTLPQRCVSWLGTAVRSHWACWAVTGLILVLMAANLQRWSQLLYCYAVAPLCAVLIHLIARGENLFTRLLAGRGLVLLGEASYSLYILHRPIHDWFQWMSQKTPLPSTHTAMGFLLYLMVSLILSVLSLKLVEYPCREWIRQSARTVKPDTQPRNLAPVPNLPLIR